MNVIVTLTDREVKDILSLLANKRNVLSSLSAMCKSNIDGGSIDPEITDLFGLRIEEINEMELKLKTAMTPPRQTEPQLTAVNVDPHATVATATTYPA